MPHHHGLTFVEFHMPRPLHTHYLTCRMVPCAAHHRYRYACCQCHHICLNVGGGGRRWLHRHVVLRLRCWCPCMWASGLLLSLGPFVEYSVGELRSILSPERGTHTTHPMVSQRSSSSSSSPAHCHTTLRRPGDWCNYNATPGGRVLQKWGCPLAVSPHSSITFLVAVGNPASRALYNGLFYAILSLVYTRMCTLSNCAKIAISGHPLYDRAPVTCLIC